TLLEVSVCYLKKTAWPLPEMLYLEAVSEEPTFQEANRKNSYQVFKNSCSPCLMIHGFTRDIEGTQRSGMKRKQILISSSIGGTISETNSHFAYRRHHFDEC